MPVNYQTPTPAQLFPVAGIRLSVVAAGIRKANRPDLTLIALEPGCHVAAALTRNRFCAAPVVVCKAHLAAGKAIRALIINTGVANAGTGEEGLQAAHISCKATADCLGIEPEQVLPFSTGVIMEPLPVARLVAALPSAVSNLAENHWHAAAHGIMTTDTVAKAASRRIEIAGRTITLTGIAKGAGMIKPNMATMLAYLATDAAIAPEVLATLVQELADESFNCITVDGDTSTNDAFVLIATGRADLQFTAATTASPDYCRLKQALVEVARELAQAIVRDGEGASKFMTIQVDGGKTRAECRQVAYAIAHSPLVKTAFFASDPNLGRILAAIGAADIADLDVNLVRVWLASQGETVLVAASGGRAANYREEEGARLMQAAEITVRVDLGRGQASANVYTCDLSGDYVKINADYRS